MLRSMRILCLFLSIFFLSSTLFAKSTLISADSFVAIQKIILKTKDPHHTLLALDDDDTLTMEPCYPYSVGTKPGVCQYLGGPAWFSWQASLSANNPARIYRTFSELLTIDHLIFVAGQMPLDDPAILDTLKTADKIGMNIVVVSARDYSDTGATEKQFQQDGILNLIEKNAIRTPSDHIGFPGYYMPTSWHKKPIRRIAYEHGILYLSGQNKGEMLKQFLAKTNNTKHITHIIFVDDTMQNDIAVAKAYANNSHVNVICIHYTRLAAHKKALTHGKYAKALQAAANRQWKNIRTALHNNLPESNF